MVMAINYDALAVDYAQHRQLHPGVLQDLITSSPIEPNSRVLEVGSGTGNFNGAIQSSCDCFCFGLDPSAGMLSRARVRSERVNFQIGRAEALGYRSGFFDLLFSVDVIHHVGRPLHYFQEAYRVLRPGGKICTVTDSAAIIRRRQPLATYFPETVEQELRRYPRIAHLRQMMERAGFSAIIEKEVEVQREVKDIRAFEDKVFSSLQLISAEAFQRGIARMRQDLLAGPILSVSRYLMLWGTTKPAS
jgi:ubiquinone/menaquinone biosynthesis C-methylase UbiE